MALDLKKSIRDIPDFPKKGILFKDITTLLKDKKALKASIDVLAKAVSKSKPKYIVGVESRGFIFGTALAYKMGIGFIPVRKKGKLPAKTRAVSYDLEYGQDTLEIHEDALKKGDRVVIVDDLLATGGTVEAVAKLVSASGAKIVNIAFIIELSFLNGRKKLGTYPVFSAVQY
ncbi:MAG: adenine phosphoribosyltransferase [Candidatus Omnitrophica bacterium]|nr:adenine phosphoribosyltransferase [Candidatus Omnitrophota bacterium]